MKYIKLKGTLYHEIMKYDGNPIYDKRNGFYGYVILSLDKILFAYIDDDRISFDELEGQVLNDDDMLLLYLDVLKFKYKDDVVMEFQYSDISEIIVLYVSDNDYYGKYIKPEIYNQFEYVNMMVTNNYDFYVDFFE